VRFAFEPFGGTLFVCEKAGPKRKTLIVIICHSTTRCGQFQLLEFLKGNFDVFKFIDNIQVVAGLFEKVFDTDIVMKAQTGCSETRQFSLHFETVFYSHAEKEGKQQQKCNKSENLENCRKGRIGTENGRQNEQDQ
jgi:hypothetical protein